MEKRLRVLWWDGSTIGDRWSGSVFYNVNFGAEGYTNNIISTSLGFSF